MKKYLIHPGLAAAALLLLAACTTEPVPAPAPADDPAPAARDDAGAQDADDADSGIDLSDARVIEMTSTEWEFAPQTLNLKKGEKVVVRLTNDKGDHSFAAKDLGINVPIAPGETKDIVIPTDTAGTFGFRCAVPCGPGHRDMTGTIVIE